MSDEMKNSYIEYLIVRLEDADLDNCAMKLVLEDLTIESSQSDKKLSEILDKLNDLQSMLAEERKSRKLPPEVYRTMGMNGTPVQHLSDLSKVPGRILSRKMVKTFRLNVCLAHVRAKFVKAWMERGEKNADISSLIISTGSSCLSGIMIKR